MVASSTSFTSSAAQAFSNGLLDFGPVANSHDDLTPALIPLEDYPFVSSSYGVSGDWPLPMPRKPYIMVSIASRIVDDSSIAFKQLDWPNPVLVRRQPLTWANNNMQDTLAPIITQDPFVVPPFYVPRPKPYIMTSISSVISEEPPTKPPIPVIFDNPIRKKAVALTWLQTRPIYYQDIEPFKQDNWPNPPAARFKIPPTWISNKGLDPTEIIYMPCSVVEWDVPPRVRPIALTWISRISQLQELFTKPDGKAWIDTPVLKPRPTGLTWIQTRPTYYTESAQLPFNNTDWKNPVLRKKTLIVSHTQRFFDSGPVGNPFSQKDWPNPRRKARMNDDFIFYYQQDDNQPRPTELTTLPPQPRRRANVGFVFSPQLFTALVGDPIHNLEWPNPIIVRRHPLTIINNLLESTLFPGEGEKPFNQNEWPNPIKGRANFHSGWIQNKPTYYTEEPLQIAQYDWPVFRSPRRHHVGYIFSQKQTEDPRFTTIDTVPTKKKIVVPAWAFSSLIDLTGVIGEIPFKQTDWPNPRRKAVNYQILSILQGLGIQLPNIVGREICLEWEDTEYYLLAGEEEYDLEWEDTEYYLDAGGNDCE